jgi:NADH dehydrogenase
MRPGLQLAMWAVRPPLLLEKNAMGKHHVVIIGGGFAGLNAVLALKHSDVNITLIDRRNFHLFQPLLYQVASGGLSPANIAAPLRQILRRQKNVRVLMGEVAQVDVDARHVRFKDGAQLAYDTLIVAAGATHSYFGNDAWAKLAPGLKTIEDATEIRQRLLTAFEAAERATEPEAVKRLLTFVIVGGGPTGVELAGAVGEITHMSLKDNFRTINPADAQIFLVEHNPRVLPPYSPKSSARAACHLGELGVQIRCATRVVDITSQAVSLKGDAPDDPVETIACATVIWAAGVRASPLSQMLAEATGTPVDRAGRIKVQADFSIPGHPEIFVIGDACHYLHGTERPLAGVAPVAQQEGHYIGQTVARRLTGKPLKAFKYRHYGSMATVGRGRAVAEMGPLKFSGFLAWLTWLFVHLVALIGFSNKALVLTQWSWNYLTRNRTARLITGQVPRADEAAPVGRA